ncbi:cupin domain-containing protein [Hymenobacter sp. BRD67]|uniref:cupin domain-containing protein n=1 Tax=Hymenobacter sp. BRD67 TaxID=2675877 RepID=UPI0015664EC2|nr:cupin domain-containing protein [Hymenobacter sp. BRD67]QKG52123.1 cupin domain-containing protein [Hymenobacter sp. BRD67]
MHFPIMALAALATTSLALPADTLPAAVYHAPAPAKSGRTLTTQQVLKGSTLDLKELEITTVLLPAGQASRPRPATAEELLVVQQGQLAVTLHDSTKTLSPGGLLLAMAGEQPALRNTSAAPVRYWCLKFSSVDGVDAARGQAGGGSFLRDWPALPLTKTEKGETRPVFNRPTSMFPRFDVHATVLNPGRASHLPHTHRAEELILMTQGNGQMLIDKTSYPAAAGDVIVMRANVPHAFTNTSQAPVGYFAIQWHSKAELENQQPK